MLTSKTIDEFLTETASNSPAPGGGSVAALAASLGLALTSMVCRLTIGKKKYADVQTEMETVLTTSEKLRSLTTALINEDTEVFNKVMVAFALPKDSEEQKAVRTTAIQEATKAATLVPLKLAQLCAEGIALAYTVAEKGNGNSLSDAGVAATMLQAACEGAAMNVNINLAGLQDAAFAQSTAAQLQTHLSVARTLGNSTLVFVNSKI